MVHGSVPMVWKQWTIPHQTYCQNPSQNPVQTQGVGGGIGSGAPPAISMGAVVGAAGFTVGWAMGAGMFTMLTCACGAIAHIVDGTGANGATVGRGGKEYGGGGTPKEWGPYGRWRKV